MCQKVRDGIIVRNVAVWQGISKIESTYAQIFLP